MLNDLESFQSLRQTKGRLLGFDVGIKTLGIAMSDSRWLIATPGTVLKRGKLEGMLQNLNHFMGAEKVVGVVVGLPRSLDGSLNVTSKRVSDFMAAFQALFPYPYIFWDERFTTNAAQRFLKEANLSFKKRNEKVDALAAALILQNFLDFCAFQQDP